MSQSASLFQAFVNQHDDAAWAQIVAALMPDIHPVDQAATRIWFHFFPLKLARALAASSNPAETVRELRLAGQYRLETQIDSSAEFLYGHRYWSHAKRAVAKLAESPAAPSSLSPADQIKEAARAAATEAGADPALLVGITAVALMTLQQVGWEHFRSSAASAAQPSRWTMSPDEVLQARSRDSRPGLRGWLNPERREYKVTFRENDPEGSFRLIHLQDLTTASAMDKRDFKSIDPRRIEGPVPMECRSATCGSCWVGVLAGHEKLSAPESLEIRKMAAFGYSGFSPEKNSCIRLGCQTRCSGNISIVIPPWNGLIGKLNA